MSEQPIRLPRVPFQRRVRVSNANGRGPCRRLWAMNLSSGGMFIRSADPIEVGTRIRVEVEWAATVIPLAEGEVVWNRGLGKDNVPGFGLRFTRVDPQSQRLLDTLVKHGGAPAIFEAGSAEMVARR